MLSVLNDPLARLLEMTLRPGEILKRRILIALAGLPGSGKSTVAARLANAVNARTGTGVMVALGMDGFHLTRLQLACFADPVQALKRRGAPWTFDAAALHHHLLALRMREASVSWPGFEHEVSDPVANAVAVSPAARIVLVEGLYLLHDDHGWQHAHLFDESWFLDVPMEIAMERLVLRHMQANAHSREVAMQRLAVNDRLNAEIVMKSRDRAHWLIDNPDR